MAVISACLPTIRPLLQQMNIVYMKVSSSFSKFSIFSGSSQTDQSEIPLSGDQPRTDRTSFKRLTNQRSYQFGTSAPRSNSINVTTGEEVDLERLDHARDGITVKRAFEAVYDYH